MENMAAPGGASTSPCCSSQVPSVSRFGSSVCVTDAPRNNGASVVVMANMGAIRGGASSPCCSSYVPSVSRFSSSVGDRMQADASGMSFESLGCKRLVSEYSTFRKNKLGRGSRKQSVHCCRNSSGCHREDKVLRISSPEAAEDSVVRRISSTVWKTITNTTASMVLATLITLPSIDNISLAVDYDSVSSPATSSSEATTNAAEDPECVARPTISLEEAAAQSAAAEPVSNESVVEEAWQVVNEFFLDARHHLWSADEWLKLKEDVLKRPIRSRMAAYGLIRGMVATLRDPYTRFLTPDQFTALAKYDVTGVGLNIGEVSDGDGKASLAILGVVLDSPAQLMGVRQGDKLLSVDGTSVEGMSAFEAASLIQGPKGTPVSIRIKHGSCQDPRDITVSRQQDVRTPVFYRLEHMPKSDDLAGYVRLREFNALAKRDLVTAIQRLEKAGATHFMLDLQDNPGGLVQAGIEIAKLFLDGGETVIQILGRDPTDFKSIVSTGAPLIKAPLVVLVNDRTASASEIVAAALHDNCRAILVGNRTFGKGLIQSVYELSDGSGLILTVGKYVTPGKIDIDGNGIEPDFKNPPELSEAKQKLRRCESHL